MVEYGVQLDYIMYIVFIDVYGKVGFWENVENIFKGMKGINVFVDVMVYMVMIDVYG